MGQGFVGGAEGGLSVATRLALQSLKAELADQADRLALLEARQDLWWDTALTVQCQDATKDGDPSKFVRADAMKTMGLDSYVDMMEIRALVESEDPAVTA